MNEGKGKKGLEKKDAQLIVAALIMMTIGSTLAIRSHFTDPAASPFFWVGTTSLITIVYSTQDVSKWWRLIARLVARRFQQK